MTGWLGDATLAHLRDVAEWPDLGERYEVTGRLGRGGMGVVYAAHDRTLDREVAVKVLDAAGEHDDAAARLRAEAQILARLEHPGIVPVHDAGTLPDGRVFYVMKLVRGARLDEALGADASIGERLEIFLRICDAVSFAHAQGIVHRDLKPANVMLGRSARCWSWTGAWPRSCNAAAQTRRSSARRASWRRNSQPATQRRRRRADVYALGVMLQALLPGLRRRRLRPSRSGRRRRIRRALSSVEALARDSALPERRAGRGVSRNAWSNGGRVYRRYECRFCSSSRT